MRGLVPADGRHHPEDIVQTSMAFLKSPDRAVFGSRYFIKDIPFRSRFGNILTRMIFQFFTCKKLIDTQTGLRVFPADMLPELLLKGIVTSMN